MTKPNSTRPASTQNVSNHASASRTRNPIKQPTAANSKTKNLDTHHCITIKWSLDSASRRRVGLPPVAAVAADAAVWAGVGGASC